MAEIVDFKIARIRDLMRQNIALRVEARQLFMDVIAIVPEDVFDQIYMQAKPILEKWEGEPDKP